MSHVWSVIARLVETNRVPGPRMVSPDGSRITIKLHDQTEVDAWVRHLGLPPAVARLDGHGWLDRYGSVDFPQAPGWCGFTTIHIYCGMPS